MNLVTKSLLLLGVIPFLQAAKAESVSCPKPEDITWTKEKPFKKGFKWKGTTSDGWSGTALSTQPTDKLELSPAHANSVVPNSATHEWILGCVYRNAHSVKFGVGTLNYTSKKVCKIAKDKENFNCPG